MASSDFDFADSDGSGIKIVATLTSFKPSDEYAKDCDLQFATLRPPTNNDPEQTSIPLPTSLEAVFIGTRGGKVSESITFEAIEWLTMGSSSIFPAFEKEGSGGRVLFPYALELSLQGDAISLLSEENIRILAALDLTPRHEVNEHAIGLRRMTEDVIRSDWTKDKNITCSDWDKLPLSLPQLKYASLDAWASELLGRRDCIVDKDFRGARVRGVSSLLEKPPLFSTATIPRDIARYVDLIFDEAQSYQDASKKEFEVAVEGVADDAKSVKVSRIAMGSFNKRLRRLNPVIATCGGLEKFEGRAVSVTGRLALVEWRKGAVAANTVRKAFDKGHLKLTSDNYDESDASITAAMNTFKHLVRYFHPTSWSPSEEVQHLEGEPFSSSWRLPSTIAMTTLSALHAFRLVFRSDVFHNDIGTSDPLVHAAHAFHSESGTPLNKSQKEAVSRALTCRLSLIRGPPGTGKTSTLAAFASSLSKGGEITSRCLIIAPANAATLRVLESVVAQGMTSVALVASKEWILEWHQDSVHSHLQPYVVSPEILDQTKQADRRKHGEYAKVDSKRTQLTDLNDRVTVRPCSKWDKVILDKIDEKLQSLPDIVIMTHGTFVSKFAGKPGNLWTEAIRRLTNIATISAVVVDEASQLWEGHAPALFDKFSNTTHFLVVGDDRQLPPFGSDVAKDKSCSEPSRSLFDAASAMSDKGLIPITQLDVSYRLPTPVASLLSAALYGGELVSRRNVHRDEVVRTRLTCGFEQVRDLARASLGRAICKTSILAAVSKHLIWLHVAGARTKVGKSSVNMAEASLLGRIVPHVIAAIRAGESKEGITGGYDVDVATAWSGFEESDDVAEDADDDYSESVRVSTPRIQSRDRDADEIDLQAGNDVFEQLPNFEPMPAEELADAEAKAVSLSRARLAKVAAGHQRIRACVITPYEGQRAAIELAIEHEFSREPGSDNLAAWVRSSKIVGNVDSLQGQEADICFISCVRAPTGEGGGGNLGFLDDNRRNNVMLSRTQQLQVIVGDCEAWLNGPKESLLRSFAWKALAEETVFAVDQDVAISVSRLPPLPVKVSRGTSLVHDIGKEVWPLTALKTTHDVVCIDGQWQYPLPLIVPTSTKAAASLPAFAKGVSTTTPVASPDFRVKDATRLLSLPETTKSAIGDKEPRKVSPAVKTNAANHSARSASSTPSLKKTIRDVYHSLSPKGQAITMAALSEKFPKADWGYENLQSACVAAGLRVYEGDAKELFVFDQTDPKAIKDAPAELTRLPTSSQSSTALNKAIRDKYRSLSPKGQAITMGALGVKFPKADWGYDNLRSACIAAGLRVYQGDGNVVLVVEDKPNGVTSTGPPAARSAPLGDVQRMREFVAKSKRGSVAGYVLMKEFNIPDKQCRDLCSTAGLKVKWVSLGNWRV